MYEKFHHGGGHHGRTHDATKLAPIMLKRPKSKTRKYPIAQHGNINMFCGDTAKKLAKQRHKKKSRSYNKKMCEQTN
jgi:hypothetical protein